jgi:hypothetical protein
VRPYLNDFITTLTSRRQARVSQVMQDAVIGKEDLDSVANQLSTAVGAYTPLILNAEAEGSLIVSARISGVFRDTQIRVQDLYVAANVISLLLNSHAEVLSSDVKAIEDELLALEKMAANYAFLLGDGKAYDFASLEPFNNENGRDSFNYQVPDRAGLFFGSAEMAIILPSQGVLALSPQVQNHGITGQLMKTNVFGLYTEESAFANMFTTTGGSGWSITVRSPRRVSTGLPEAGGRAGAQVLLEFETSQPAPASQIRVTPLAEFNLELLQARLFRSDDDSTGVDLMADEEIRLLDRPTTLHFPMQIVSRFQILLNQPIYQRSAVMERIAETEGKILYAAMAVRKTGVEDLFRRLYLISLVRQLAQDEGDLFSDRAFRISTPKSGSPGGLFDNEYLLGVLSAGVGDGEAWKPSNPIADAFYRMALDRIPELRQFNKKWDDSQPTSTSDAVFTALPDPAPQPQQPLAYEYQYRLGLANVAVGVDSPGFKGVFVSKTLDAPGDIGVVRVKAAHTDFMLTNTLRDSEQVTSVEYSISNAASPRSESDWIPILPIDTDVVTGERFLPDINGRGLFRFEADPASMVRLYRNGRVMQVSSESYLRPPTRQAVLGIALPIGEFGRDDIFTVDYRPVSDQTIQSFETRGFSETVPLVAAYGDQGAGEYFASTTGRNEVTLAHTPYIDNSAATAAYFSNLGGHLGYNPIVVQMNDRTIAINLTNYTDGPSGELPLTSTGYFFRHSGRTLLFNQPVADFRVFYPYLRNSVRFRVVLRVNHKDFVSPSVDFVHLKAKTRRPNAGEP